MSNNTAEEHKAAGNAALQAGNYTKAIEEYTAAIRLDGANHVYFSNRSAAYLSQGDAHNALEDAAACIGLQPTFAKGYSRKGAALHALQRYNDSIAAYQEGLRHAPQDTGLLKGLEQVQRDRDRGTTGTASSAAGGIGGLFGPQMMAQMALDPRMRPFLNDPEVMGKIRAVQQNPSLLSTILQDSKMMQLLSLLMGADGEMEMDDTEGGNKHTTARTPATTTSTRPDPPAQTSKGTATTAVVEEMEEDWSDLTPEERAVKEKQKQALQKKKEGNDLYAKKQFQEAIAAYEEAIALDPSNMAFLSNKAAVLFEMKNYQDCINVCMEAVQVGQEHRASFEDRAKALTRAARAYHKMGNLEQAIELCNKAQLDAFSKDTQRLLKTLELEKKKADTLAYQDDAKAEEAKQRGNEFFRQQKYGEAVQEYEDAVKRAPKNAPIRNNLAAALCKIGDFSGAQRQIEEALVLDPKYVKAYARRGDIEMYMKEYHKAMESYKKGLELEPENPACKEGLQKVLLQINYGRRNMTEAEKREQAAHAMADPEIQAILQDPVTQQILRDFSDNPNAAQQAMKNPGVRAKIEKLIAAGIIETA